MRFALYIAGGRRSILDFDHFCVVNSIESMRSQVEEFRSWEPDSGIEELDEDHERDLRCSRNVTLRGANYHVCIRPIQESV